MQQQRHLRIAEPYPRLDTLKTLLICIADKDYEIPIRGCTGLLRKAEKMGLVRREKPVCANGNERRNPVTLTNLGASVIYKKGE